MNLLADSAFGGATSATRQDRVLPPLPRGFSPRQIKDIEYAEWIEPNTHPVTRRRPRGTTLAQKAGHRFERNVRSTLSALYTGDEIFSGRWLRYGVKSRDYFCQPDFVVAQRDRVLLFEIKLSTTCDAWWQLVHQYGPILESMYQRPVALYCIVKNHVPEVRFPNAAEWPLMFEVPNVATRALIKWR